MTLCAQQLERIADIVLDRLQISSRDLADEAGLGLAAVKPYTAKLERDGRIHRLRPLGAVSGIGRVWAAGRAPREDGEKEPEPVHLSVRHWRMGPVRQSPLELYFFGAADRVPHA